MFLRSIARTLLVGALVAGISQALSAQAPAGQAAPALTVSGTLANDTVKGASLLAEARKALGGEDKLAAIKRIEAKGTVTQVAGNQTLDGDMVLQIETPDKMRIDQEISLPGGAITIERTQALNGAEIWDVTEGGNLPGGGFRGGGGGRGGDFRGGGGGNPGGRLGGVLGALGTDPTAQAQADPARQAQLKELQTKTRQTDFARYLVALLATTSEAPAWQGTAVTPKDEKADVLEFKTADGTTTRLFLEITTHMPLMMTYSGPAARGGGGQGRGNRGGQGGRQGQGGGGDAAAVPPGAGAGAPPQGAAPADAQGGRRGGFQPGQPTTIEMYLGDYKVENGVKMPHHITREVAGEIQEEVIFKSFKFNPNFKSNTFTAPKQ